MPTRTIVIDEQQDGLIDELVRSGRFENASQVIGEGLRLVHGRETANSGKLDALRAATRLGMESLDRGEFKDYADAAALVAHLDDVVRRLPFGPKGR